MQPEKARNKDLGPQLSAAEKAWPGTCVDRGKKYAQVMLMQNMDVYILLGSEIHVQIRAKCDTRIMCTSC